MAGWVDPAGPPAPDPVGPPIQGSGLGQMANQSPSEVPQEDTKPIAMGAVVPVGSPGPPRAPGLPPGVKGLGLASPAAPPPPGAPYEAPRRTAEQIDRAFTYHAPQGTQPARYVALREAARVLAHMIASQTPASREQALALTKLEEATFWANAAIARNE